MSNNTSLVRYVCEDLKTSASGAVGAVYKFDTFYPSNEKHLHARKPYCGADGVFYRDSGFAATTLDIYKLPKFV